MCKKRDNKVSKIYMVKKEYNKKYMGVVSSRKIGFFRCFFMLLGLFCHLDKAYYLL